uniref:Secreted protein n=1 Tax=Trichogramma kaykai TaxID=54128 RepID=A0ABD2X619_9HYME
MLLLLCVCVCVCVCCLSAVWWQRGDGDGCGCATPRHLDLLKAAHHRGHQKKKKKTAAFRAAASELSRTMSWSVARGCKIHRGHLKRYRVQEKDREKEHAKMCSGLERKRELFE